MKLKENPRFRYKKLVPSGRGNRQVYTAESTIAGVNPDEVLQSIEEVAPVQGLPIIGPRRGVFLDEVVKSHRPSRILEVGTLVGYSAIRMGRHLKEGQKVICVELREEMASIARSNIAKAGLDDRIELKVGDALKVLPTIRGSLDMVFLDAVKEDYLDYLKSIEKLLHKGSVVVADNVRSHATEVRPYLDYVRKSGEYSSEYKEAPPNYGVDAGDAVEISVKL
jgi:predicted O-methyltransferase YrrM